MNDVGRVRESVIRQISVELNIEESLVCEGRSLRNDLKMDSVAAANILFALEEMYGVEIDLDAVVAIDCVADIVSLVMAAVADR